MKYTSIALLVGSVYADHFQTRKEAASHLQANYRVRRDNSGIFEEVVQAPSLERECMEDICSREELSEILNDPAEVNKWWFDATNSCSQPGACSRKGTKRCVNQWRKRACECRNGWTNGQSGNETFDDCSIDIDECAEDPNWCLHGSCENNDGGFMCTCEFGWVGDRCDTDVNECEESADACLHDGVCTNTEGGYECACPAEWEGATCEIDVNECDNSEYRARCQNGSGCINKSGSYECLCNNGWSGQHCDADFDECTPSMCPEGTMCVQTAQNQFVCECPERGCNNLDATVYESMLASVWVEEVVVVEEPVDEVAEYDTYAPVEDSEDVVEDEYTVEFDDEETPEEDVLEDEYNYDDVTVDESGDAEDDGSDNYEMVEYQAPGDDTDYETTDAPAYEAYESSDDVEETSYDDEVVVEEPEATPEATYYSDSNEADVPETTYESDASIVDEELDQSYGEEAYSYE